MNALELKRVLDIAVRHLENILKSDLDAVSVDPEWSDIDVVKEHIEFLIEQTAGLRDGILDKKQSQDV
jgi:hypothetical protein